MRVVSRFDFLWPYLVKVSCVQIPRAAENLQLIIFLRAFMALGELGNQWQTKELLLKEILMSDSSSS